MFLREVVTPESTLDALDILFAKPFFIGLPDIPVIYGMSRKQRSLPDGVEPDFTHDYSVDSAVYMAYTFHRLEAAPEVAERFLALHKALEKGYVGSTRFDYCCEEQSAHQRAMWDERITHMRWFKEGEELKGLFELLRRTMNDFRRAEAWFLGEAPVDCEFDKELGFIPKRQGKFEEFAKSMHAFRSAITQPWRDAEYVFLYDD